LDAVERAARLAAEAVADRLPQPTTPAAPAPVAIPEMSPEDASDYKVLLYMAKQDPKLADLPAKFLAFVQKAYAYQDDWSAKNPDDEFKWEDEAHAAWYSRNAPPIDRDAMKDAADDMRVEEKVEKRLAPLREAEEKKQREAEAAQEWEQAKPKVNARVNTLVVTMVDAVNPELGKLLRDANGNPDLRTEAVARVEEADSVAHDILNDSAMELVPILAELEKSGHLRDYRFNARDESLPPAVRRAHAAIQRHVEAAERDILSAPAAEQIFNGKQFTTTAEMSRLKSAIINGTGSNDQKRQKLADLDATRTCLTIDDLQDIIVAEFAARAKAQIDRIDGIARKKYAKNGNGAPATAQNGERTPQPEPVPQPAPRPQPSPQPARPPSISSGSDMLTAPNPAGGTAKTTGEQVAAVLFK